MSDREWKSDLNANNDAQDSNQDDDRRNQSSGIFGGISGLANDAQHVADEAKAAEARKHTLGGGIGSLADAAQEAIRQGEQQREEKERSGLGGVFTRIQDMQKAAEEAAKQAEAKKAEQENDGRSAAERAWDIPKYEPVTVSQNEAPAEEEPFVGSGGVGSSDQLDAIRRGYEERGLTPPSAYNNPNDPNDDSGTNTA